MLETDAADRPDEEVLVVRSGDGQFADVHEEDADDVGEAAFEGARRPDVIFERRLPDLGGEGHLEAAGSGREDVRRKGTRDWRPPRAIGRFVENFQSRGVRGKAARLKKGPRDWEFPAILLGGQKGKRGIRRLRREGENAPHAKAQNRKGRNARRVPAIAVVPRRLRLDGILCAFASLRDELVFLD